MLAQGEDTEVEDRLAANLRRRAVALGAKGEWGAGLQDLDKAIEILTRLAESRGEPELAEELTGAKEDRKVLRQAMGTEDED